MIFFHKLLLSFQEDGQRKSEMEYKHNMDDVFAILCHVPLIDIRVVITLDFGHPGGPRPLPVICGI